MGLKWEGNNRRHTNWSSKGNSHEGQKSKDGELHVCGLVVRDLELEREIKVVRRQKYTRR